MEKRKEKEDLSKTDRQKTEVFLFNSLPYLTQVSQHLSENQEKREL